MQNDEDPKIAHNVAVAEYYLRGSTNPSDLLDALAKIRCGPPPRPRPAPLGTAHAAKCNAPRPPPAPIRGDRVLELFFGLTNGRDVQDDDSGEGAAGL